MNRFTKGGLEMFELFVTSQAARDKVAEPFTATRRPAPPAPEPQRPRREAVRSTSAAALRSLAARLEPSPGR
jgi:hypothetical protein